MSENKTKLTSLPQAPRDLPPESTRFMRALRDVLGVFMGENGDTLDRVVTFRDLIDKGVLKSLLSFGNSSTTLEDLAPVSPVLTVDQLSRPPVPSGLTATGGFDQIYLQWDTPVFAYLGFTEVWCSNDNLLAHAVLVGTAPGTLYVHKLGGDEAMKYYWIRHISRYRANGAPDGPFSDPPVSARLALNVNHLISILSESYQEAHPDVPESEVPLLFVVRPVITVGGEQGEMVDLGDGAVFVPSGVYIKRAAIARATITTAQIKELSADKIVTGTIAAGETISVGGSISGGKTLYSDIVPGWWIGSDGGIYKMAIGDNVNYLKWDGDSLIVRGQIAEFDRIHVLDADFDYLSADDADFLNMTGIDSDFTRSTIGTAKITTAVTTKNIQQYSLMKTTATPADPAHANFNGLLRYYDGFAKTVFAGPTNGNIGVGLSVTAPQLTTGAMAAIVPYNHVDAATYYRSGEAKVGFRATVSIKASGAGSYRDGTSPVYIRFSIRKQGVLPGGYMFQFNSNDLVNTDLGEKTIALMDGSGGTIKITVSVPDDVGPDEFKVLITCAYASAFGLPYSGSDRYYMQSTLWLGYESISGSFTGDHESAFQMVVETGSNVTTDALLA